MATYKFVLFAGNRRLDNSYPVSIRITKNRKSKYIKTSLSAKQIQWDENAERFIANKKLVPNHKQWNARLAELEVQINELFRKFEVDRIDWTLNQFADTFLNKSAKGSVSDYFNGIIDTLKDTAHFGNSICYSRTLRMLELFDKRFATKVFSEIDFKYVKSFDVFLQKRECKGNTRKYYLKTLRAVLNKAIQEKEASGSTYPFGRGGFNISALEEETAKRYLPNESMEKIKNTVLSDQDLEITRRIFLFSYYCYGISFIDAALLTQNNVVRHNEGYYIVYKRNKTKETKRVKPIQIRITDEIQGYLNWFAENTRLIDDHLLPIVSIAGLQGEELYKHIRNCFSCNNRKLSKLAKTLDINDVKLTSYVSRHTMAMTLQNNKIAREIISQILGHTDLSTTNTYLDHFSSSVIDEAVKVL